MREFNKMNYPFASLIWLLLLSVQPTHSQRHCWAPDKAPFHGYTRMSPGELFTLWNKQ